MVEIILKTKQLYMKRIIKGRSGVAEKSLQGCLFILLIWKISYAFWNCSVNDPSLKQSLHFIVEISINNFDVEFSWSKADLLKPLADVKNENNI